MGEVKKKLAFAAGVGIALALMAASPALASTVDLPQNGALTVQAGSGETNNLSVSQSGETVTITDSAGVTSSSPYCAPAPPNRVNCNRAPGDAIRLIYVSAGDGDDIVTLTLASESVFVSGGTGNDRLDGSTGSAHLTLNGDAGNDTLIGGPHGDQLDVTSPSGAYGPFDGSQADVGDDTLSAGAGPDRIRAGNGADIADGGEGGDFIEGVVLPLGSTPGLPLDISDDGAVDQINCGPNTPVEFPADAGKGDTVLMGSGDLVGIDCEIIDQLATCPSGSNCVVVASITASPAGASSSSLASAAASNGGGKQKILGKEKMQLGPGQKGVINTPLRRRTVRKTLGKRSRMPATLKLEVKRKGKDRTKKVRFKLKR